jgi:hypothetical protein
MSGLECGGLPLRVFHLSHGVGRLPKMPAAERHFSLGGMPELCRGRAAPRDGEVGSHPL